MADPTIAQSRARFRRKAKLIPKQARWAAAGAMQGGAQKITAIQKRLAPTRSGELARSGNWGFGDAPKGAGYISLGSSGGKRGTGVLKVSIWAGGPKAFYARFVEFGTQGAPGHGPTPSQPFFFPVWRALKRSVKGSVTRAASKAIRKIAKG